MPKFQRPIRYLPTITDHIERYFGTDFFVLDEKKSSVVHVDVHVVRPTPIRPYFTLLTSGMSDLDMRVPEGLEDLALAEVCLCLPKEWPLAMDDFGWREPRYFWPIAILQQAARYPAHKSNVVLWGHTVGSVERPEPLHVETRFTGLMLANPATFQKVRIRWRPGRPSYSLPRFDSTLEQEMKFKQKFDSATLVESQEADVTELLNPKRSSVV